MPEFWIPVTNKSMPESWIIVCGPIAVMRHGILMKLNRTLTAQTLQNKQYPYSIPSPHRGRRRIEEEPLQQSVTAPRPEAYRGKKPYSSPSPHRGRRRIKRRGRGVPGPHALGPLGRWEVGGKNKRLKLIMSLSQNVTSAYND